MSARRRKKYNIYLALCVVVLLIGIMFFLKSISLHEQKLRLQEEYAKLNEEYRSEQERSDELWAQKAYMNTIQWIEDMARKMGLVYENEVLFRNEDEGAANDEEGTG